MSDASDDSDDNFQFAAHESGDEGAPIHGPHSDDDSERDEPSGSDDGSDEDADEEDEAHDMFDMEASESDGESEDEDSRDESSDDDDDEYSRSHLTSFPQFMLLPPEIRMRVWELYCPEMTANGRVYDALSLGIDVPQARMFMRQRTQSVRAVLSVHHESRAFAEKFFPHTLRIPAPGDYEPPLVLRFHREKDIVYLKGKTVRSETPVRGLTDQICNLGLTDVRAFEDFEIPRPSIDTTPQSSSEDSPSSEISVPDHKALADTGLDQNDAQWAARVFPRLRNVFFHIDHEACSRKTIEWCVSDHVKRSPVYEYSERLPHGRVWHQQLYCWPDLDAHRSWAETNLPLDRMWKTAGLVGYVPPNYVEDEDNLEEMDEAERAERDAERKAATKIAVRNQLAKLAIWPLLEFDSNGVSRFERLVAWSSNKEGFDWDSQSDYSDGIDHFDMGDYDLNEDYESEGIDDSEIEEHASSDEDEDDLMVLDDRESISSDDDDGHEAASDFEGFSPTHGQNGILRLTEDGEIPPARFSSPESDTATIESDSDGAGAATNLARRGTKKRLKPRVVESDSDEEDETPKKRARTSHRIEDDESEEEDQAPVKRSRKRVVQSDSDEEDEGEAPRSRARVASKRPAQDDEDDEDEDDIPRRQSRKRSAQCDSDEEPQGVQRKRARFGGRTLVEDDESEESNKSDEESEDESESGESDGDEAETKHMSLAERLQLHRQQNPVSDSEQDQDSDSDRDPAIEDMDGDDYDTRNYADFQDDDEGNGSDDEERGGGYMIDMDEGDEDEYGEY
ncbi:hypothetical protein OQA88_8350 [Cercophora sp. LCS_1]